MKKKMLVSLCLLGLLLGLSACGNGNGNENKDAENLPTESQTTEIDKANRIPLKDMEVEKYVTLGDYKAVSLTAEPINVLDSDVESMLYEVYCDSFPEDMRVMDREVVEGDITNIDYVGKKDGVAFEGGTAEGAFLRIGSHQYIDGFEEGLIGAVPGETRDLNLKFPENYGSADLAGQSVVFTVTVNYIIPEGYDAEAISQFGMPDITNEEQLREYIYQYIYSMLKQQNDATTQSRLVDAFLKSCEFNELPEGMLQFYKDTARKSITEYAVSMNTDPENFIYYYYQMGFEDFLNSYAEESLKQNIAAQAVANKENLNISDEELNETLLEYATGSGYSSVEEYVGDADIEDFREYFMYEKVMNYIMENATIIE